MSEEFAGVDGLEAEGDDRAPLALALGLAAAIVAGVLWAVLVNVTNYEIGYAAWGVGVLVGVAMSKVTQQRTQRLAMAAALFAVVGLAAGKAFMFAGSAGTIAEELNADQDVMRSAIAWQMYDERALDAATLEAVDRAEAGTDTLSDAAWVSMLAQADTRLSAMSSDEREAAADAVARTLVQSVGVVGGIKAQLSPFDALWILLAVGTAFRMLAPEKEPELAVAEQA